ncbi:hypothetical protein RB195_016569 [Necator americanus]|uniref:Uncharacterized protein n=1 Tax=Necator americanus TaxID=51031 RepID=A0ABR1C122_NECAM
MPETLSVSFSKACLKAVSRSQWYNPLAGEIVLSRCTPGNTSWEYDKNLIATREVIEERLRAFAATVEHDFAQSLSRLPAYVSVHSLTL